MTGRSCSFSRHSIYVVRVTPTFPHVFVEARWLAEALSAHITHTLHSSGLCYPHLPSCICWGYMTGWSSFSRHSIYVVRVTPTYPHVFVEARWLAEAISTHITFIQPVLPPLTLMCLLRLDNWLKLFTQTLHLCGLCYPHLPACVCWGLIADWSSPHIHYIYVVRVTPTYLHVFVEAIWLAEALSTHITFIQPVLPPLACMCLLRLDDWLKLFPHILYLCGPRYPHLPSCVCWGLMTAWSSFHRHYIYVVCVTPTYPYVFVDYIYVVCVTPTYPHVFVEAWWLAEALSTDITFMWSVLLVDM